MRGVSAKSPLSVPVVRAICALCLSLTICTLVFALLGVVFPICVAQLFHWDSGLGGLLLPAITVGILCVLGIPMLGIYLYERWENGTNSSP